MKSLSDFIFLHILSSDSQRLGQRFVNNYIKTPDEETTKIFNEKDSEKAQDLIRTWLTNNQHTTQLPEKIK